MFKEIMKYEKAWKLFCEWMKKNWKIEYSYDYLAFEIYASYQFKNIFVDVPDDFILAIMPFFFKKMGIHMTIDYSIDDSLLEACEKSFSILEEQLND